MVDRTDCWPTSHARERVPSAGAGRLTHRAGGLVLQVQCNASYVIGSYVLYKNSCIVIFVVVVACNPFRNKF